MSALRRMRQTDADINFKPWIFEIARNAAIDQYRRNGRTDEVSIDIEGGFAPSDVSRVVRPRGPDSSMLDKERLDHLRGALDELSDTHHRIIVMRELEGLSYREIGEKMELTPAAVESTLFRARRKLEHEYSQLDTGRRCQLMGAVIGRLAEGLESDRDRRRLDRHARRCSSCRRRSRQLGVEPILPRRPIAARAAAFLPLPACSRAALGARGPGAQPQHAAAPIGRGGRLPRSRSAPRWRARPWPSSPPWRWSAAAGPPSAARAAPPRRQRPYACSRSSSASTRRRRRRPPAGSGTAFRPAKQRDHAAPVADGTTPARRRRGVRFEEAGCRATPTQPARGLPQPAARTAPSAATRSPEAAAAGLDRDRSEGPSDSASSTSSRRLRVRCLRPRRCWTTRFAARRRLAAPSGEGGAGSLRGHGEGLGSRLVPRVAHGHQPLLDGGLLLR